MTLKAQYGPWAVIAGASEGIGRALARRLASEGIHCVLVARRTEPLEALAEGLKSEFGVECITASVDLSALDACEQIERAVGEREIGLYVSNAGADPNGAHFLDRPAEAWLAQVQRGAMTMLGCCHKFGSKMKARGRGGILLIGSGGCYGGAPFMATYSALKAFGLNFAESLWAELEPHGVDVLYMALGATDTPALRRLLESKGTRLFPGLAEPDAIAEVALARLPHGPLHNWGQDDEAPGMSPVSAAQRRARVLAIARASKRIFGG